MKAAGLLLCQGEPKQKEALHVREEAEAPVCTSFLQPHQLLHTYILASAGGWMF